MAKNLKELIEQGIVQVAKLPPMNEIELSELDKLAGYTVPLIEHDYSAKTPLMWNTLYKTLGLNLRNIMVVANPDDMPKIFAAFKSDPKYMGGGAGVGFKEKVIEYLDTIIPKDIRSVNIIVKDDGTLKGYNTDSQGLYTAVKEELEKEHKTIEDSRFLVFGAGGVAKDFTSLLAKNDAGRIVIVNRSYDKAVKLAHELNAQYSRALAQGASEDMTRGHVLNTLKPLDAIINTSDKGSDKLPTTNAFAPAGEYNNTQSIDILRNLVLWNPNVVIVDIVLPKDRSITLRHADSVEDKDKNNKFKHLIDGVPMVINQAAPAYKLVEAAYKDIHTRTLSESEILRVMRKAVNYSS